MRGKNKYKTILLICGITVLSIFLILCYVAKTSASQTKQNIVETKCFLEEGEINIYYPQFKGFEDKKKQDQINALIFKDISTFVSEAHIHLKGDVYINIDYQIKYLDENIISIFYTGLYGVPKLGEGLSPIALATTIDVENEKSLMLNDVVCNMEELNKLLLEDRFESITEWEGIKGTGKISREYIGCEVRLLENLQMDSFDIFNHYVEWYIEDGNFVFVSLFGNSYEEYSIEIEKIKQIFDNEFLELLN